MTGRLNGRSQGQGSSASGRRARPNVEDLECRLLMYGAAAGSWSYGQRITFSFVPDGTSVSGAPSTLYQTMTSKFGDPYSWQLALYQAASVWQGVANINLAYVPDDGSPLGTSGLQQGDTRFGDIRISAIPMDSGTLAGAFSPPPANYGTGAGDIILNSTAAWQSNAGVDLETVAIHEFGHALGMSHSQIASAVMYAYFHGVQQSLTSDDVAGIQAIYGARQYDTWNSGANYNGYYTSATPLNWFLDSNYQITTPYPLNITKPTQTQWFKVVVPNSGTGAMTVIVQSYGLSTLSPSVGVYDAATFNTLASMSTPFSGSVLWKSNIPVTPGQTVLISVNGNGGGSMTGAFGLQINFGTYSPATIPLFPANVPTPAGANTTGTMSMMEDSSNAGEQLRIGDLVGTGDTLTLADLQAASAQARANATPAPTTTSSSPSPSWALMGPVTDAAAPPQSSNAVFFVTAARDVKKAVYPRIRGIERAASNWALQSAPLKTFSGKMRSPDGSISIA